MGSDCVIYTRHPAEGVAEIIFNRPAVMNAMNVDMATTLADMAMEAASDRNVRVLVLTGRGTSFMSGGDIHAFHKMLSAPAAERRDYFTRLMDNTHRAVTALRRMEKPVIAGIHGTAAGPGFGIALACDLVVASDKAVFQMAYGPLGTTPDGGSTHALPRLVGSRRASELALLDRRLTALEALELGLVNRVCPAPRLAEETRCTARQLAFGAATASGRTKRLLYLSLEHNFEQQLAAERDTFLAAIDSEEFAEGITAFVERRRPQFGRCAMQACA
ncbi:enoyl-CoA hydratase/isomerase family protein [Niveispirillum irakense]|uniref:enoyl-CoA hydratase/isomerase family protein n=1 Tax=Niveispirillum irakense TaxID=34011 RepID=UPI0004900F0A|nr:enoyl-CoA hydratase-related protein [Niveispirillum irakense]